MDFETPSQLAERIGVPVANIRHLIRVGELEHIYLTPNKRNPKIPTGAWERFIQSNVIAAKPQGARAGCVNT